MTTAALLPTPGDPFHVTYWLRHFRTWADAVDELHVFVNGQKHPAVLAWIAQAVEAVGGTFTSQPERKDHGRALDLMLTRTDADRVLFCEDDAFVREPDAIAEFFGYLDDFDIIGSPRESASGGVLDATYRRWGPAPVASDGLAGHGLFPAFLFGRREAMLSVSTWGAEIWQPGDYIAPLDLTCATVESSDTAGLAAYELRAAGRRMLYSPQHRSRPEPGRWFHVGSLSTGYGLSFADDTGYKAPEWDDDVSDDDWAKRASWWERFLRTAEGLPESQARYRAGLDSLYARGLSRDAVRTWTGRYDPLITWPE